MGTVRTRGDGFSNLVRQILVIEKRRPIRDVAAALGMEYASFHARVIGRTHFKAEEISALIREVPDPRLCDFLLRDTPFLAVSRPPPAGMAREGALHAALRLAGESLATIEQIGDSLMDGQLEPSRYDELGGHVLEAERAVSNLRASMPGLAPRKGRLGTARASPNPLETTQ